MQDKKLMFVWTKTLLSIYKYIDTLTSAIDDLVYKQSINSGHFGGGYYNSAYCCASKVIELSERKRKLLVIKDGIDDALATLPSLSVRILVLTYFDLIKSSGVAKVLNISIRTFFRRKNVCIEKLSNALSLQGWTSEKLINYLKNESWLIDLYNGNLNAAKESDEVEFSNVKEYKLLKCIFKDLNKINKTHYTYLA